MLTLFKNFWMLLFLGTTFCFSQSQPVFKKVNQSNGLSTGRITAIVKEEKGYVWIGTNNGLNRFDGQEIKVYSKQNSAITSNDISDILIDSKNRIWIATLGGGLNFYDPKFDTFKAFKNNPNNPETLMSDNVGALFEDSKGLIWLGTEKGLCYFNPNNQQFVSFTNYFNDSQIKKSNGITSIYEDKNSNLWIGTFGNGLFIFDRIKKKFKQVQSKQSQIPDFINAISALDADKILLGTRGSGLLLLDINSLICSDYLKENLALKQEINIVRSLKIDSKNNLWIGTDGNGLLKVENFNKKNPVIHHYLHNSELEKSLSGNAIFEVMEDDESNIWIGTAWDGVCVIDQKNKSELLYGEKVSLKPSPVLSIFKKENLLFLGLDGEGFTEFNTTTNKATYYNSKNGKSESKANYIQKIIETKEGLFWLGTFKNGLIKFDRKTKIFTQYKHESNDKNSISFDDVRDIIEDENNNLWLATWGGGLNYFDTKTQKFTAFREGADTKTINNDNTIDLLSDGTKIWIATFGGGLNVFDTEKKKFTFFKHKDADVNTISNNNIFALYKDSKNYLWIGTSGGGINRMNLKTNKIERFEKNDILNYQSITAIIEDHYQTIWFSTKQGIINYNYKTKKFTTFSKLTSEFHINAAFKDENGLIYFGGIDGVVKINPKTITTISESPEVKLTNFKLFNKEVPVEEHGILSQNIRFTKNIVLKHDQDVLTFEFAALEFPFSNSCEYAIKMENFDEDWRFIGKDRAATYTNLAPGDYVFKVKSREKGSEWSQKHTSISLTVLKPFWFSWIAIFFYFLVIISIFYFFRKYIIAWEEMKTNLKLEKINHEKDIEIYDLKQQFFTNISHDIRTPITLILGAVNRLISNYEIREENQPNPITTIKKNSNHLLKLINELLDFRKLEQRKLQVTESDFSAFTKEIYLSFTEMAFQKNITFTFETTISQPTIWFNKNEIEKVLYNLLSNAFKFTNEGNSITLLLSETNTHIQVEIIDQGIGMSKKNLQKIFNRFYKMPHKSTTNSEGWGLGLAISKEIIELHQGEIRVESKAGKGSNFTILLKKGNSHFSQENIDTSASSIEDIANYFTQLQPKTPLQPLEIKAESNILKDKTILVVEDNIEIRAYIIQIIAPFYEVIEASNGVEALEIVSKKAVDLIISDVMMPKMDGIALTKSIKTNVNTSHLPIILLTARSSYLHKMEGFETGADDYILKPFDESLLLSRIKSVLRNRELMYQKFKQKELIPISQLELNKSDEEFMQKIIKVIEQNMSSPALDAKFVGSELAMSHSVLYKKIKALTNMTFIEFVRDYKLKTAKHLISEKNFSVQDASFHVGYSDRKYFSKLFKTHFGSAPSDFLKNKNKE
jgi:hypothetical protein